MGCQSHSHSAPPWTAKNVFRHSPWPSVEKLGSIELNCIKKSSLGSSTVFKSRMDAETENSDHHWRRGIPGEQIIPGTCLHGSYSLAEETNGNQTAVKLHPWHVFLKMMCVIPRALLFLSAHPTSTLSPWLLYFGLCCSTLRPPLPFVVKVTWYILGMSHRCREGRYHLWN